MALAAKKKKKKKKKKKYNSHDLTTITVDHGTSSVMLCCS